MEVTETIVFLFVALVVGGMLFGIVKQIDISNDKKEEKMSVDKAGFVVELVHFWELCAYGEVDMTKAVYVKEAGEIDVGFIFDTIKASGYCDTLQSSIHDCGRQNDLVLSATIQSPKVVSMECRDNKLYVS